MPGDFSFAQVPIADIPRSVFNRTHGHKTTFDAGYLVPFFVDEALPGDTFTVNASVFARLATPIVPIMDNMHMEVFFFAVPNRLVWDNWQRFMGEQPNPGDSTDFLVPMVGSSTHLGFGVGSIFDYFGLPTSIANPTESQGLYACAFWSRAYNLIWNEWFRDENLQDRAVVDKDDGIDAEVDYPLRKRGKRHDYFTSCLPWPQKGPGVQLSMGASAPVVPIGDGIPVFGGPATATSPLNVAAGQAGVYYGDASGTGITGGSLAWSVPKLSADLSQAVSVTINSMRQAFQVQKLLERDARGGTRYTEILRSHFGVVSPDARLQRPEYLGGGSVPVMINPVAQTSGTAGTAGGYTNTPQGNLAGYGVTSGKGLGFSKSFVEHSVILGLVCVRADLSYQQGVPRMFSRRSRYDFYWPALSHLGEQAVYNKEIFIQGPGNLMPDGTTPVNDGVFGYQERWAEYRYAQSKITGKFRSTDPQSLDFWHLAQKFDTLPTLSDTFIEESATDTVKRVVAVQTEPQFLFDSHIMMKCVRPMPTYSVPGLIDHF